MLHGLTIQSKFPILHYLKVSLFGFFESAQVVVGAADVDVSSNIVVLHSNNNIDWLLNSIKPIDLSSRL